MGGGIYSGGLGSIEGGGGVSIFRMSSVFMRYMVAEDSRATPEAVKSM